MFKYLSFMVLFEVFIFDGSGTYHHRRQWHHQKSKHSSSGRKVMMPSGKFYYMKNPTLPRSISSGFKCGDNSTLTYLDPDDWKLKKEYDIVKKEVEKDNTKLTLLKIEKIFNPCLWEKYSFHRRTIQSEMKNMREQFLFHGSNAGPSLINHGFDERYANLYGYYGAGVYFSPNISKSNGYLSVRPDGNKLMLLCRVALGNVYNVTTHQSFTSPPTGYHSVLGLNWPTNPEYMVYRGEQVYPEFAITYKI